MAKVLGYAVAYVADNWDLVSIGVTVVNAASEGDAIEQGIEEAKREFPDRAKYYATACEIIVKRKGVRDEKDTDIVCA